MMVAPALGVGGWEGETPVVFRPQHWAEPSVSYGALAVSGGGTPRLEMIKLRDGSFQILRVLRLSPRCFSV